MTRPLVIGKNQAVKMMLHKFNTQKEKTKWSFRLSVATAKKKWKNTTSVIGAIIQFVLIA